jgi:hypothetical protein
MYNEIVIHYSIQCSSSSSSSSSGVIVVVEVVVVVAALTLCTTHTPVNAGREHTVLNMPPSRQ